MRGSLARSLTAALSVLLLAASDTALAPGLWEVRGTPEVASLDGQVLGDFPLEAFETQLICLTPADAADPVGLLFRDTVTDCTLGKSRFAGGVVRVSGTCASQSDGPPGTVAIQGRYDRDSYAVTFATEAQGENGLAAFSGSLVGCRIGDCPAH